MFFCHNHSLISIPTTISTNIPSTLLPPSPLSLFLSQFCILTRSRKLLADISPIIGNFSKMENHEQQQNKDGIQEDIMPTTDKQLKIPLNTQDLRKTYRNQNEPFILEENMYKCPFQQFDAWFKNVRSIVDVKYQEVNACALSTVGTNGQPSSRMVLLKGYSDKGFVFFTHSISRKGQQLVTNPRASMLFYWPIVDRQIEIEGDVVVLEDSVADEYWHIRPLPTRIGSKISEQSAVIPSREYLMQKQRALEKLYEKEGETVITRPNHWLGYALRPNYVEFWQGQSNRVHDRIVYELQLNKNTSTNCNNWIMKRLSP